MALQKPLSKLKSKSQSPAPDQAVQPRPASPNRVLNGMPFTIPSRGPFYMKIRGPDSAVIDRKERAARGIRLHRHRFRPGNARGGQHPMARRGRSDPTQGPEAGNNYGRSRARRARLHDLPEGAPRQAALDESD